LRNTCDPSDLLDRLAVLRLRETTNSIFLGEEPTPFCSVQKSYSFFDTSAVGAVVPPRSFRSFPSVWALQALCSSPMLRSPILENLPCPLSRPSWNEAPGWRRFLIRLTGNYSAKRMPAPSPSLGCLSGTGPSYCVVIYGFVRRAVTKDRQHSQEEILFPTCIFSFYGHSCRKSPCDVICF